MSTAADSAAALVEQAKKAAAFQAVQEHLLPTYKHIGIGSGSTVVYVVEAIAALGPAVTNGMRFYSTGEQSATLITSADLKLGFMRRLGSDVSLDVCFDGADEVDEDLNLIKGGGACLWQEKIVVANANKFICVVDYRKIAPRLGTAWKQGIPIEVNPEAVPRVLRELKAIGAINPVVRSYEPAWRQVKVVTDNHQAIIDAPFPPLLLDRDPQANTPGTWTVDALAARLKEIVGVAEIGLFYGKVQKPVAVYIGLADGTTKSLKLAAA
ncbi:ribose 5-phosphate isomerase [Thozetella sp. PMI_491]|nr:ribose 5-phosphate isomerase [Thozetella sp. PMI_491]